MLKVALEIMLSQKIAALFALMVFASQGVMGRPSPDIVGGLVGSELESAVASIEGELF